MRSISATYDIRKLLAESDFQRSVIELAKLNGWLAYHTHDSRHSEAGFPDTALLRPPRFILAELKVQDRQPTDEQIAWLTGLEACGIEAYLWRPDSWPEIERLLAR